MGFLASTIGTLKGGGAGTLFPRSGILGRLLGGRQAGSMGSGTGYELGGLVLQFQQGGLGHIAQSWVGSGPNQPVTPEQLHGVLGAAQVRSMASQVGMQPSKFLVLLSQRLPEAVDGMTPDGHLPDEGTMSV